MGSWRRMGAFLGLVPEDEGRDGQYGDELDAQYVGREYPERYGADHPRQSDGSAARSSYAEPVTRGALAMQVQPEGRPSAEAFAPPMPVGPAVSTLSAQASRPLTVKLTGFGEARIIGERYRDGASVILDMTELTDADARRVVDFAAGLAFALHGSIDKVTTRVFMLLPPHADLSAEDRRAFAGHYAAR